jgi:16S rRNA processing protein RimM
MSGRIAVGVIRKPHGVRGEASVEAWTNTLERFHELDAVMLVSPDESSTRATRVESVREHAGRVLVKLAGLDSPEALGEYRDWTIEIPESEAKPLEDDEYFLHDLVGLTMIDAEGRERGTITDAYEGGGGILLEVKHGGKTFDVPFAADICTNIDLEAKTMRVNLPEGIDE